MAPRQHPHLGMHAHLQHLPHAPVWTPIAADCKR
jgi:hypothetical protein